MQDSGVQLIEYMSGRRRGAGAFLLRCGLRALAVPYRLCCGLRAALYHSGFLLSRELEAIVISVGNITTGGTGKTPLVVWLARWLQQHGIRPAILSRGYGAKATEDGDTDEMLLFRRQVPAVPHLVGKDRCATGREAIEQYSAECVLLDDGFQHLAVGRDLDIVCIDSLLPWGYGHILPRGLLREPLSGLRRADVVVLTRCDLCPKDRLRAIHHRLRDLCGYRPVVESVHRPVRFYSHPSEESRPLGWAKGRKLYAFSALGNPTAFPGTLEALGADVVHHQGFRDHHWYGEQELAWLAHAAAEAGAEAMVTTEKDAVKIQALPDEAPPLYVLAVELTITRGEELLTEILEQVIQG